MSLNLVSQNLITDPSFEHSYDTLKSFYSDITLFKTWKIQNKTFPFINPHKDDDALESCDKSNENLVFLVINLRGDTIRKEKSLISDRLYSKLIKPITKGKKYKLSYHYKVGTSFSDINCNGFGICLEKFDFSKPPNKKYLVSTEIVKNREWKYYEELFIAENDFDRIIIGVFLDAGNFKFIDVDPDNMDYKNKDGSMSCRFHVDCLSLTEI